MLLLLLALLRARNKLREGAGHARPASQHRFCLLLCSAPLRHHPGCHMRGTGCCGGGGRAQLWARAQPARQDGRRGVGTACRGDVSRVAGRRGDAWGNILGILLASSQRRWRWRWRWQWLWQWLWQGGVRGAGGGGGGGTAEGREGRQGQQEAGVSSLGGHEKQCAVLWAGCVYHLMPRAPIH